MLIADRLPFKKDVKLGDYFCCYCETGLDVTNYSREHVIPVSRGGKNVKSNLRACCKECNTEKDNMMLHTYIQMLNLQWADSETDSGEYRLLQTKIKNANKIAIELGFIYEANEQHMG